MSSLRIFAIITAALVALALAACHGRVGTSVVPQTHNARSNLAPVKAPSGLAARASFLQTLQVKRLTNIGAAPATQSVHLIVTLAHRNQAGLQQLIAQQATPGSPYYEHFLTPQEFDAQFGPTPQTRNRIKAALAALGFTVDPDRFGASVIEATGTVAIAAHAFATSFENVQEPDGRVAMLPLSVPAIPLSLQQDVVSVVGLDTTDVTQPKPVPSAQTNICPQTTQICCPGGICCYGPASWYTTVIATMV